MNVKRKTKVFPTNQTMMQLLHFPLTIELESKTHTHKAANKKNSNNLAWNQEDYE